MSGQNRKINNATKQSSGSKAAFSQPFFTYRTPDMQANNEKEIRCNPKVHEVGRPHKSIKK
jgi:hypothetical protein